jgi:predicted ribosome-associated RNA-binding protein Tma20
MRHARVSVNKGVGIENMHYLLDDLWKSSLAAASSGTGGDDQQ